MDNDLLKHIEDFMSGIDDSWSEFKKSRYIFKNLGLLYNYDPQYIYSGPMIQNEILKEAVKNNHKELVGINEDEVIQEFVNNKNKICLSLSNIYYWLLKRAGVEDVELLSSDVIIKTEYGKVLAKLEQSLLSTKMNTDPEGFELLEKSKEEAKEILKREDIELGFLKEDYNNLKYDETEETEAITVRDKLNNMLEKSDKYFESVIGRKINNVELHKYYNYLLGTAFKRKNAQIFPFHNWDFTNMKYVIIGREYEEEKYCYFLYDDEQGKFNEKSQEEIREMLKGDMRVAKKYEEYVRDNPIYERD